MKVFNKEINSCFMCDYYRMSDDNCNILNEDIQYQDSIHKDCPFNKPITTEVIESFGFVKTKSSGYNLFVGKFVKFNIIYNYNNRLCLIEKFFIDKLSERPNSLVLFKGTINNPIELEFILRSVGAIE